MDVHLRKLGRGPFLFMPLIVVLALCQTLTITHAQTKATNSGGTLTADQQKQLNRLQQLNEQIQRDGDAVRSAASQHGWDSDEADAAQQRLFQDRQEYRALKRSLQQAGVSVPPDMTNTGMGNRATPGGHCGHHANGHHGCCGGDGHCPEHDNNCCC